MKWDIQSFVIKCIFQGGDWFDWLSDMLEIKTISACLPYEADPYVLVICHTFSVTLAVCMTCILETPNYWSISLPSPLMEADFAFVKEMCCAWKAMCMQVCSWMFPLRMYILIYAVWELQWTVMHHETYVVTYTLCTKAQSHFSVSSYFHSLLILNWLVNKKI